MELNDSVKLGYKPSWILSPYEGPDRRRREIKIGISSCPLDAWPRGPTGAHKTTLEPDVTVTQERWGFFLLILYPY